MAQLFRTVFSRSIFSGNRLGLSHGSIRGFFSSSSIGLDNFKMAREQHISRYASSIESFKKRFLESVQKVDSQIFTEDLRNMILSANNDEEIDALVQGLKRYNLNKIKFTDYHFGSPIMRLLYIQDKADLALELFLDESLKDIFRDVGSVLILMNKLVETKRYDDALKTFDCACKRGFQTSTGRFYPTDVVMLAIETFYRQNTKESLVKAKELLSKIIERDSDINPRTAAMIAILAIQQNEPGFALEMLGSIRIQNLTTIQNIRAICYAEMGRIEEAINTVHLLADQPPVDDDRRRVFPLVLETIRKAIRNSMDQDIKSRFEDLSKFVMKNNRLSQIDLIDFVNEPIYRRSGISTNRSVGQNSNDNNVQRSKGNTRNTDFRRNSNQQSNTFRQGIKHDRYNRSQSDHFSTERTF